MFNATGGHIATWGEYGSGLGQFIHPYFIALDTAGSVYVADSANHRVQKFTLMRVVPGAMDIPRDLDGNARYEDVNGNGRKDFADVVLFFNQMTWIAANEPLWWFDNSNSRIDFADVVWLFNNL